MWFWDFFHMLLGQGHVLLAVVHELPSLGQYCTGLLTMLYRAVCHGIPYRGLILPRLGL